MTNDKWKMTRFVVSIAGIVACLLIIWINAQAGLSRLLGKYAILNGSLEAADTSVALASSDPEAHRVRAAVLYQLKQVPEAAKELERAIALRPHDDYLWLELALIKDELEDPAGANLAFNESVRLAPFYAYPRWQRGNFLLRQRRFDEAFADLRQAAASNPTFIPNLIDLAWAFSGGDVKTAERLAQITGGEMRAAFAGFLAKKGKSREAAEQLALTGDISEQTRKQIVRDLISAKAFHEAYKFWKKSNGGHETTTVYDGGFEGSLEFDEFGFGWRLSRSVQGVELAGDTNQPQSGVRSLLIEFQGNSNPDTSIVSQLIVVEPSRRYRINFAVRTKDLVTGGLPIVAVNDAETSKRLGQSPAVRPDMTGWRTLSFEFQTDSATKAVVVSVQREGCTTPPCPIFGSVWLDSFSVEEISTTSR
jgi:tetratricopeptide (TPR) repeat protein